MRKFSLVFAVAAVVVTLALSGGAWAESIRVKDKQLDVTIIMEGEIIHKGDDGAHSFTITYNDELYFCLIAKKIDCWKHW